MLPSSVQATDYHVWGGTGNDGNDGSVMDAGNAWATLAHADDVVSAGDTVYIKGAFTSQQTLNSATNGNGSSWDSPVIYKAYDDNDVDCTGGDSAKKITGSSKQYIEIDGFYNSTKRFRLYDGVGKRIIIQANANNVKIHGCKFNYPSQGPNGAVRIFDDAHHVWIYDNDIKTGTGANATAIYIGTYQTLTGKL